MHKIIFDLFVNRSDTYSEQSPKGTYSRIEESITEQTLQDHLDGKKTIGIYQLNQESKIKWICFDFDGDKLEEQEQLAKNLYLKLKHTHKAETILMEFSGKKGYHIWVFTEPIDAQSAKIWAEEASESEHPHEIFPKQTSIEKEKFGNLVKLPLGIHQVTGKRTFFFDEEFKEIEFEKSIDYLQKLSQKPLVKIPRVIVKEIIRTIIKPQGKMEMPSYIKSLIENGVKEGERHKNTFIITKELYNLGYTTQEILDFTNTFNNNCRPPQPKYLLENHVNYLLQFPERYLTKNSIQEIPTKELARIANINYEKVIEVYKKWFCLQDTNAIDLCLAVALTRKSNLNPLWLILIAASGSGKSELIKPFEDKNNPSTTEVMSKITPNTFLSGVSKAKIDYMDFAETLSNNPKLFLTYDFAQFVKMDSHDKAQVWAQMRDLYDGFIERKAALGVSKKVTDIRINWLICTTPIIDSELIVHQELGTRELIFRFDEEELNVVDLMERVWDNSKQIQDMRKELAFFVRGFIEKKESDGIIVDIKIEKETKQELMNVAKMIAVLRAATESDSYSGELTNFVYQEKPTRVLLQLKTLFIGLKNIDIDYSDEKALKIVQKVALSSINPVRLRIIIDLLAAGRLTTTEIQKRLSVGYKTIVTQLYSAKQLGLVDFSEISDEFEGNNKAWIKKTWTVVNDHEVIRYLMKIKDLKEVWLNLFEKKAN